jgi:hypothetical protein
MVFAYGPQPLAALGTFRFLITELVPLQVLVPHRLGSISLSGETDTGPEQAAGDFSTS